MSPDIAKYHLWSKINHWFQNSICKSFCQKKKCYKHSNADYIYIYIYTYCKLYNSLYFNWIKYNDLLSFLFLVMHCLYTELSNVTKSQIVSSLFKIPDYQLLSHFWYPNSYPLFLWKFWRKMLVFLFFIFYFKH